MKVVFPFLVGEKGERVRFKLNELHGWFLTNTFLIKKNEVYLFIQRERERDRDRERVGKGHEERRESQAGSALSVLNHGGTQTHKLTYHDPKQNQESDT